MCSPVIFKLCPTKVKCREENLVFNSLFESVLTHFKWQLFQVVTRDGKVDVFRQSLSTPDDSARNDVLAQAADLLRNPSRADNPFF